MCCPVCGVVVQPVTNFLTCGMCKKWVHSECDRSFDSDVDDYSCAKCRSSPIVGGDAMLSMINGDSPLGLGSEVSNQGLEMISTRSSPVADSLSLDPLNFTSGGGHGGMADVSGLSGSSMTSSDSARNSPSFCDINSAHSEDDEEFKPGRGGTSSRGGRGGGKKKPGGRGGTLMKTRSGGQPPSGIFSDRLGKSDRGKRGKGRGAGKAGSGKGGGVGRGRGRGGGRGSSCGLNMGAGGPLSYLGAGATGAVGLAGGLAFLQQAASAVAAASSATGHHMADLHSILHHEAQTAGASASVPGADGRARDDEYVRTNVIAEEDDKFLANASICLVCGSVGKGVEQSLIACSCCAHTFHTYCVGLHEKMNSTVVNRGWRCLDCTICEGCGVSKDDSKLIMCEECDVAYHMYCLNPPLERAPSGPWRCQWCAKCRRCQMRVASSGELTKEGLCQQCYSLRKCPKCAKLYNLSEHIIRCSQCMRWYHGACEDLHNEEMLEAAASNKMRCSTCRPSSRMNNYTMNDGNLILCDNVALNKCADEVLQSKMMPSLFRANSFTDSGSGVPGLISGFLSEYRSGSMDSHLGGSLDDDNTPDDSIDGLAALVSGAPTSFGGPGSRGGRGGGRGGGAGRGRMLKLGVGGFFVKVPRHRLPIAEEEAEVDADGNKKVKRQRKPRRSHLEDAYPSQIQEGFFGIRAVDGKNLMDTELAEPVLEEYSKSRVPERPGGDKLSKEASEAVRIDLDEKGLIENLDFNDVDLDNIDFNLFGEDDDMDFDIDDDLNDALAFAQGDGFDMSRSSSAQPAAGDSQDGKGAVAQQQLQQQQVPSQQPQAIPHPQHPHAQQQMQLQQQQQIMHPQMMQMQQQQMQMQQVMGPSGPMMIKQEPGMISRTGSRMSVGSDMGGAQIMGGGPAPVGTAHGGPGVQERQSAANVATERWEEDEPLGEKATKAAVLYVNLKFPNLRDRMPEWSERAKYIHRMWRGLGADERQQYVTMARYNRAQREKVPRTRMPRMQQLPGGPITANSSTGAALQARMAAGGAMGPYGLSKEAADAFKRPNTPGFQPPSSDHLSPELQQEYAAIRRTTAEMLQKLEESDKQLNQMRTLKKKLSAKKRQLQKQAEVADAAAVNAGAEPGTVPPGDLNDNERASLIAVTNDLPGKQREVENMKRDYKTHQTTQNEFEMRHQIQSQHTLAMLAAQQQQVNAGSSIGGMGGMMANARGFGPGMAGLGPGMGAGGPPGAGGPYQQLVVPQQIPFSQMMGPERGYPVGMRPGMMMGRMGPMGGRWPSFRSPVLGSIQYDQLRSQEEREIYECLDDIIGKISIELDGPPPHMHPSQSMMMMGGGPTLKRMLEPMQPNGGNFMMMAGMGGAPQVPPPQGMSAMTSSSSMDDPPKQKKKRVMQKKAGVPGGNDYENALDRLRSALASCPQPPKKAFEPPVRNEPPPFHLIGMSDLGDKYERLQNSNVLLGRLQLPFASDTYSEVKKVALPGAVSMNRLMPNARVNQLQQMTSNASSPSSAPFVLKDDQDLAAPSTSQSTPCADVLRGLVGAVERKRPVLRCSTKIPDWSLPPSEPHRIAFKEAKKEEEEEVEISLEVIDKALAETTTTTTSREELAKQLLQRLQEMLDVKKPIEDYELDTPPQSPTESMQADIKPSSSSSSSHLHHHHSSSTPSPPLRCRLCDRDIPPSGIAGGVRQSMSQLGLTPSDDGKEDSVTFCSLKCYYMFVATAKVALSPEQLGRAESHVDEATYTRLKQISADSFARCIQQGTVRVKQEPGVAHMTVGAMLTAHHLSGTLGGALAGATGPPPPTPIGAPSTPSPAVLDITSPKDSRFFMDEGRREHVQVIRCSDLSNLADSGKKERQRAAGEDWKKYDQELLNSFLSVHHRKQELAEGPKMGVEDKRTMDTIHMYDRRICVLCGLTGDGDRQTNCGRLLNYDSCAWVHANCALWSCEVYETPSGGLVNVDRAVIRGVVSLCNLCGRSGATVQCFKVECLRNFHFTCANRMFGQKFLKDKNFICPNHNDVHMDALATLEPLRRLYVHRDENKLLAKLFESSDVPRIVLRLGALTFYRLGQLLPEQLKTCHNERFIFPIGYTVQRAFWSPSDVKRRLRYSLTITEHDSKPLFTVAMPDGSEVWRAATANDAWKQVFDAVARVRDRRGDVLRFVTNQLDGESLYGLEESVVTKITESLPGVDSLYSYTFRHGGTAVLELPLAENPSGCARCEPRLRTLIKHRKVAPSAAPSGGKQRHQNLYEELQMQMRMSGWRTDGFGVPGGNKWDQYGSTEQSYSGYQKMRKEWRNTVYLARSKIQGLGLYAKRDIDMGAMIIEYKGEVIRAEVCEMREKKYFAQNRGTYMFRASDECIIDATMKGGPARYINHSCDPNCATHIMHLGANGEDKKIIITANRPIKADEELTYDYQFDIEDDSEKVACLCGAPNCQRWMN